VVHFTRSLSYLKKSHGIRVVAICPAFAPTPIVDSLFKVSGSYVLKALEQGMVTIEKVIDAFMMGIENESLTGTCIRITPEYGIDVVEGWKVARRTVKL